MAFELTAITEPGRRLDAPAGRLAAQHAEHDREARRPATGRTVKARERLTAEGRWADCRAELLALAERHNRSADGRLHMDAEYLVAVARGA